MCLGLVGLRIGRLLAIGNAQKDDIGGTKKSSPIKSEITELKSPGRDRTSTHGGASAREREREEVLER